MFSLLVHSLTLSACSVSVGIRKKTVLQWNSKILMVRVRSYDEIAKLWHLTGVRPDQLW